MAQNDSRKTLQILFEEEKYEYIYIPRIQRDYAQGRIDGEATVIRDNILDDVASRKPLSEPQYFDFRANEFGESRAFYFRDPDGIILEMMQPL